MTEASRRLAEIAEQLKRGEKPEPETVRTFLSWFGAQRRGHYVAQRVKRLLRKNGLTTIPDFQYAYIDSQVTFELAPQREGVNTIGIPVESIDPIVLPVIEPIEEIELIPNVLTGAIKDPTYRIGKLPAANNSPARVSPNSTLQEAVTLMLGLKCSQLPVMQTDWEVKGIVSWSSIGAGLALGNKSESVSAYMEQPRELSADDSLFVAIPVIVEHGYVLIRDNHDKRITGIVTTSDLSLQFQQLGEPFLLLEEIENHIRVMVGGKFTPAELKAACDPTDTEREVTSVADLSFGEYVWLLQKPEHWDRLKVALDRKVFTAQLDKVRLIRNDVMHFDPDGLSPDDLEVLRGFVQFLQKLREIASREI